MVNKTYRLKEKDANRLISYVCRFKEVRTSINLTRDYLNVFATFLDSEKEPTSLIAKLELVKVSDEPAKMTPGEYKRWVKGEFSEEE